MRMQGDVTPRAALPIAARDGQACVAVRPYAGRLRLASSPRCSPFCSPLLLRRSCRRRRAARRAARRDAVVDRGRQQPHHAHRRRLQRPVRELAGRARLRRSRCRRTVEGYASLQKAGPRGRRAAPAAAAAAAAPPPRAASAAPAPMGGYTVRPGDTLSGLAAGARVSVNAIAAMNGLDPTGVLLAGTRAQAADRRARARARRAARARPRRSCPPPRPSRPPTRVGAGDVQSVAAAARRLPLARHRDRLAGERLQQRHGLLRQRPRRHAGHAGHVGLRAAEPRRRASSTRTRRPTT